MARFRRAIVYAAERRGEGMSLTLDQRGLLAIVMRFYIGRMERGEYQSTPEHMAECKDALAAAQRGGLMGNRPNSERLAAHSYMIQVEYPSKYDRDTTVTVNLGIRCPRCKEELNMLEHGESQRCFMCGLHMELMGNALEVWEKREE
jgi:ribosomal protein S27AE